LFTARLLDLGCTGLVAFCALRLLYTRLQFYRLFVILVVTRPFGVSFVAGSFTPFFWLYRCCILLPFYFTLPVYTFAFAVRFSHVLLWISYRLHLVLRGWFGLRGSVVLRTHLYHTEFHCTPAVVTLRHACHHTPTLPHGFHFLHAVITVAWFWFLVYCRFALHTLFICCWILVWFILHTLYIGCTLLRARYTPMV